MHREELTPELIRRAVALYMHHAWPGGEARPIFDPRRLEGVESVQEIFELCERPRASDPEMLDCYSLRLGNEYYPFMKCVLHEYLLDEEFFFVVDTHDDFDVPADNPDHGAWQRIRLRNRELKQLIEADWAREGIPTHRDLLRLAQRRLAGIDVRAPRRPARILVVDDDQAVAQVLRAILEARGYRVELAHDGREALERLARDPLPDLVLLDYSMPELDGQEVLRILRENPRTRDLSVLVATASDIDLADLQRVSGFLRKPYPIEVLLAMLDRLLGDEGAPAGKDPGAPRSSAPPEGP